MADTLDNRKKESYKIFDEIAGTYDFLNHLLSFGIDIYWRNKIKKNLPMKNDLEVLDLATGTGDVALTLIKDKKVKKVTGLDLSKGMVELGKKKVAAKGLTDKVALHIGDGVEIPAADETFDVATISFGIRNFPDPQRSLVNIERVLRPGGRCMIMEFSLPKNALIRAIYFFYFRHLLPFVGNILSKHKDAYSYLNESVEDFPYGDDFEQLMRNANLKNVHRYELTFGIATLYIGDKH
ncbi:bifunctional demethylmenaquinone methyltransferase/2-methoxy-6-polyprenyl-1,4-benzoquinol methylase UbiE [Halobacteriovorax sp. GB3]|uniref:bifunctional demethylmenaquinone methyltransferase/2-methoxy-6-polyprenyl-1,4-benzoquinol methylase UbiE n=1 Tax=Halobacteriovorax sp. GB3 TaxID=2719615 RepID=UPI002361B04F|nr:bifunctional demethylmenaquinone methyltransferase/2-methoxy-6-polyprenyl-1,4-benzoquinol methylase UbiE [Halobacteriovorax sp. GB3]MDD0852942.1 bifunctional demethylmenaquinone methyltransferase/2-methoxy-6-polyprenyl-1,4-benzoquinol methylase UbiE [Halobacteriovorax sp. GB3]